MLRGEPCMVKINTKGKKYLFIPAIMILSLILVACSPVPGTLTTSSAAVSPTPSTLPQAAAPTQTVVQSTPTPSPSPTPFPATATPPPLSSPTNGPVTPTSEPPPPTSPIYTPVTTPVKPSTTQASLYQYMLDLINKDRQSAGLNPVVLNYNSAAQKHAQDMLDNNYQAAHWGTDGYKPYMRYTVEGGLNYEQENSAYYSSSKSLDLNQQLKNLQSAMMAEVPPNDPHRVNILNKWHKKVNLGIASNANTLALVQQFEGDYVAYSLPPTLNGNILSLTGHFLQPEIKLNNISIAYDAPPQPLTSDQLTNDPQYHHYGLGERLGIIFPPPPPGQLYSSLPANSIVAKKGDFNYKGWFYIETDISAILAKGPGVYTVVLVALVGNEPVNLTNYSLFVN
jgi:uncharacterized protein YkwD